MLILAIETSGEVCGIALARDGELLSLWQRRHRMDLLARLTAEIDEMLRGQSLTVGDLDGVAVSLGPGSFTGLRIGVSTAKALAFAAGKPIVGVPTLDVLAKGAACASTIAGTIVAVSSARPGEVYAACYRADRGNLERLTDYLCVPIESIGDVCPGEKGTILVCGPAAEQAVEGFRASGAEAVLYGGALSWPNPWTLAMLGQEGLQRGESDDVVALVPLYVRKPTPEVRLEQRQVDG